jgi:hypothetical protein
MSTAATTPHGTQTATDFQESELYAFDPRVAPGLPRPVGWRVRSPDGTQAYDKYGPNDTDWMPVGSAGGTVLVDGLIKPGIVGPNPAPSAHIDIDPILADGSDEFAAVQNWINSADATAGTELKYPSGSIVIGSAVSAAGKIGLTVRGRGRSLTKFTAKTGFNGDLWTFSNSFANGLHDCTLTAQAQRTAGVGLVLKGGNTGKQLTPIDSFLQAGNFRMTGVDMDNMFSCLLIGDTVGPVSCPWVVYASDGLWRGLNGEHIRLNAAEATGQFGASHFFHRIFCYSNPTSTVGTAIRITGTGDATFDGCETFGMNQGLLINPPVGQQVSALRFNGCFFDSSNNSVAEISPGSSIFEDIAFNASWFASSALAHGLYINSATAQRIRAVNCAMVDCGGWGVVIANGALDVTVDACMFWGNFAGGVIATRTGGNPWPTHFAVRNCHVAQGSVLLNGVYVDGPGPDFYTVALNDLHNSTTPFTDLGGAVNKIVTPNLL